MQISRIDWIAPLAAAALALAGTACQTDPVEPEPGPDADAGADGAMIDGELPDSGPGTDGGDAESAPDGDAGPGACRSDRDCSMGEVCRVEDSDDGLRTVCETPPDGGGGRVGDSCSKNADCRSNLCYDGTCSKPCERPNDCKSGWTCEPTSVSTDSGDETLNICRPGASKPCKSDGDCAGNKKCVASRGNTEVDVACGSPNAGGGGVGDSCTSDGDCIHNLCVGGECAPPCGTDRHCSGASDYTCTSTDIDVGNGSTDSVSVCRPPRPCDERDQCRVGEECYVERDLSGSAGVCRNPNPGGRSLGDVCKGDGQCAANLCYSARFRDICTIPCRDVSDCPKSGFRCKSRSIDDGSGGTRTVDICVPAPPQSCRQASNCGSNRTCAIVPNTNGTGLERVCAPQTGGLSPGNSCSRDSECNSRLCLDGHCSAPCVNRGQCGSEQLCRSNSVSKQGLTGSFKVCETPSKEQCTSSGTCSDGVRLCSKLATVGGQLEAFCRFPNSNASGLVGDSCSTHGDCRSKLCLSDIGKSSSLPPQCSVACQRDGQCASGQICTTFPTSGTDVAICTERCSVTGNCSSSYTCQINENRLSSTYSVDTVCKAPPGSTRLGGSCSSNGDCESGTCLNTYTFKRNDSNDQTCSPNSNSCPTGWGCHQDPNRNDNYYCADEERRCTKICQNDSDCSGGVSGNQLTDCGTVNTTLSDGSSVQVNACTQP